MEHDELMGRDKRFALWYSEHHDRIRAMCGRMLRDSAAGEDLAQETLLRAWTRRDSLRDEDVGAWLTVVARNLCISYLRRHGRVVPTDTVPDVVDAGADPLATVERLESRRAVRRAMRDISERPRRALYLHEVNGADYDELGRELGLSPEGVRSIAFRARKTLRTRLAAVGEGFSAVLLGFKVQVRDLRARLRNITASLENGVAQTGLNIALVATVSVGAFAGTTLMSAAEGTLVRDVAAARTTRNDAAAIAPAPGDRGVVSNGAQRASTQGTEEASRHSGLAAKAKIDARPYNRDDGSGYYDINILGAGGTLTRERTDDEFSARVYRVEDFVFPIACEHADQLCWSDGTEGT